MPLFFVDLLGVKARWANGGRVAAEEAFQDFWNLIGLAMRGETPESVSLGLVESDSAAIDCASTEVALRIARRLYLATFLQTERNELKRHWLRGVILQRTSTEPLRRPSVFKKDLGVDLMLYSRDLLDAINIEKCGFKGMRVVISEQLINGSLKAVLTIPMGKMSFVPLKKLRHSSYPNPIAEGFRDYLWMADASEEEKRRLDMIMARRLRHASRDSEESLQAAATQVVFHEVTAILGNLKSRARRLKSLQLENNQHTDPETQATVDDRGG